MHCGWQRSIERQNVIRSRKSTTHDLIYDISTTRNEFLDVDVDGSSAAVQKSGHRAADMDINLYV